MLTRDSKINLNTTDTLSVPKTRILLKDFSLALRQQLYFWGQDVLHKDGNLLCMFGLERIEMKESDNRSSCYREEYEGDTIELHGLCVGRYSSDNPSFLFTRTPLRSSIYDSSTPPVPGHFEKELIITKPLDQVLIASQQFLKWWLEYEAWIATKTEPNYRQECYKRFKALPKSKAWLPPLKALEWLTCYMKSPENLQRAREWKKLKS